MQTKPDPNESEKANNESAARVERKRLEIRAELKAGEMNIPEKKQVNPG